MRIAELHKTVSCFFSRPILIIFNVPRHARASCFHRKEHRVAFRHVILRLARLLNRILAPEVDVQSIPNPRNCISKFRRVHTSGSLAKAFARSKLSRISEQIDFHAVLSIRDKQIESNMFARMHAIFKHFSIPWEFGQINFYAQTHWKR